MSVLTGGIISTSPFKSSRSISIAGMLSPSNKAPKLGQDLESNESNGNRIIRKHSWGKGPSISRKFTSFKESRPNSPEQNLSHRRIASLGGGRDNTEISLPKVEIKKETILVSDPIPISDSEEIIEVQHEIECEIEPQTVDNVIPLTDDENQDQFVIQDGKLSKVRQPLFHLDSYEDDQQEMLSNLRKDSVDVMKETIYNTMINKELMRTKAMIHKT